LAPKYPIAIMIVDEEKRIREFLPALDELITEGVATLENCEMIRYYRNEVD
jgi:PII-like signaling protein